MTELPAALRGSLEKGAPSQDGMDYIPARWAEWLIGLPVSAGLLEGERAKIDRAQLCTFVHESVDTHPVDALVAVYQWGYGTGGRGPSRARKILTGGVHDVARTRAYDPTVAERLADSVTLARSGKPYGAYAQLARGAGRISGFGPAFFTKWLYAVSAQGDPRSSTALPILDSLVQDWIKREAGITLRTGNAKDYAAYVDLLDEWADTTDATVRIDVELAIFALERAHRAAA
ncbi:8-oxoguanine DNA glycosylase OGG fold protein [Demequina soli]|uniref:8-oxoguanine DNA glycosylase OGG fold protein n=1 Tax=Demequina soli TaxID=1638987 RepID=UPI00078416B6|nr:hypothetical protein [Demequina soli]